MREYLIPTLVVAALALAGCNKPKSPEDVSKDVANAEQKASNEVAKSEARAQRRIGISNAGPVQGCPQPLRVTGLMLRPSLGAAWLAWAIRAAGAPPRMAPGH